MPMNLGNNLDIVLVEPLASAGTGALASTPIDVTKWNHVEFVLVTGTVGTGTASGLKVQWSATSGGTYADVTGATFANIATTDDDKVKRVSIAVQHLPDTAKFLKVVGTIATEAIPLTILALGGIILDTTDGQTNAPEANV